MSKRRAHTRTQAGNHDTGFDKVTTDHDETGTWHSLDLEQQAYQAMLEAVRQDPDDQKLAADLLKARQAMDLAWLAHQPTPAAAVPTVTLSMFLRALTLAGLHTFRTTVIRTGIHRRKERP